MEENKQKHFGPVEGQVVAAQQQAILLRFGAGLITSEQAIEQFVEVLSPDAVEQKMRAIDEASKKYGESAKEMLDVLDSLKKGL